MSARHILALAALLAASPAAAESDPAARGLALRANTAAAARVPRLSVISGAEQWYGLAATLTPGTFNTVRVLHRNLAGCTATGLRLLAGNYGWANTSSAGSPSAPKERQNPYPITIHSAFEFAGTKTDQQQPRSPVRWNGQPTATLTPSSAAYAFPNLLLSDPVSASVAPGAAFYAPRSRRRRRGSNISARCRCAAARPDSAPTAARDRRSIRGWSARSTLPAAT